MTRLNHSLATAIIGGLLVAGPQAVAQDAGPIKVGVIAPLSGQFSAIGEKFRNAISLHAEQLNERGGIDGRQVEVVFEDSRGTPREAANIAQKFASDGEIVAVVGGFTSSSSMAAAPILADAQIPQVSPTASHPDYTHMSDYQFRMVNTQAKEARYNADLMVNKLGAKRIVIPYFQDDWGIFVAQATEDEIEKRGGEVILSEAIIPQTKDFRPLITKIKSLEPDGIFLTTHFAEGAAFLKQLEQAGVEAKIGGTSVLYSPNFLDLLNGTGDGMYVVATYFPDDPRVGPFAEAYEAEYGETPSSHDAWAYDSFGVIAAAIEDVLAAGEELSGPNVRDALAAIENYPGVSGTATFDEVGDVDKEQWFLQIVGNKFVPFE